MKEVMPAFHVLVLQMHKPDSTMEPKQITPEPIEVNGEQEWQVEGIIDC